MDYVSHDVIRHTSRNKDDGWATLTLSSRYPGTEENWIWED